MIRPHTSMKFLKLAILASILALATGGFDHGQPHLIDGAVPHVHADGVIHIH